MLIEGYCYEGGPLTAGEPLAARPGFWANHLLEWCAAGPDGERPEPEWFGDDGADTEALAEVLYDERAWPVLRAPFGDGHRVVVVLRNVAGDPGLDFLLTHPGWARAEALLSYDGDRHGPGLGWRRLLHVAETVPDAGPDEGLSDPDVRLLLLLPLLEDGWRHARQAVPRIAGALRPSGRRRRRRRSRPGAWSTGRRTRSGTTRRGARRSAAALPVPQKATGGLARCRCRASA